MPVPRASRFALAEPTTEVELGEQDEVGAHSLRQRERLGGSAGGDHLEAVVCELPLEEPSRGGLRLGDDQGG